MKVSIIGSGVAGLAAGYYLQKSGFETVIYERNHTFGGLCTSWKKGGFTFESGFQWLLGSGPGSPFFRIWSELLDMDTVSFVSHEIRMDIEVKNSCAPNGDKVFHLYANLERLREYLLGISPEDHKPVEELIGSMRRIQKFEIPPMILSLPDLMSPFQKMKFIRHLPLLLFLRKYKKETNFSFAAKLMNPFLKEAFEALFDLEDLPLMIITIPLAFNDLQATGYPIGGAATFVEKILSRYQVLGGKVRYNAAVRKIMTEKGRATGVQLADGEKVFSDFTVSAADWHFTMFNALEGRFVNKVIRSLGKGEKLKPYYSVFMVSLGLERMLDKESHFLRFPLESELMSPDGTVYRHLESHIYNYDPTLAPDGSTVLSASFYTMNGEYWIRLRESDPESYRQQKMQFAEHVIDLLDKKYGNIRNCIRETDVATPATFNRYTNNWKGSVQGWLPGKNLVAQTPVKFTVPGLKNFYFAGHWTIPGGGLPVAVKSARDVAQLVCHEAGQPFGSPTK